MKLFAVVLLVAVGIGKANGQGEFVETHGDLATLLCVLPNGYVESEFNKVEMFKQVNNGDLSTADKIAEKIAGGDVSTFNPPYNDPTKYRFAFAIEVDRVGGTLVIFQVEYSDNANYWCVFTGPTHTDQSVFDNIVLTVRDLGTITLSNPQPNRVHTTTDNTEISSNVMPNTAVTFTCLAKDAHPAVTLQWYINNTPVTSSTSGISITSSNPVSVVDPLLTDTSSMLTMTPNRNNHGDVIRCNSTQELPGKSPVIDNRSFTLDVLANGAISLTNTHSNPDDTTTGTGESTDVSPGQSATFICVVKDANPEAVITWFIDGSPVNSGTSGFTISPSSSQDPGTGLRETRSTLTFTPQISNHDKAIVCRSTQQSIGFNDVTSEAGFKLSLYTLPDAMRIYVRGSDENNYNVYTNNANVFIKSGLTDFWCTVTYSNPVVAISWMVDGSNVVEDSSSGQTNNDYDSYILDRNIQNCIQVTCAASNVAIDQLGQQTMWTRTVNIQVTEPPEIPKLTLDVGSSDNVFGNPTDDPIILLEGNTYVFNCEASRADPEADILWTLYNKDNQQISTEFDLGVENVPDCILETNIESYTLQKAMVLHESIHGGYLECKAYNNYHNDANSESTVARVRFKVFRGPNETPGSSELALRYRLFGTPDTFTEVITHNDAIHVSAGSKYEFQCEIYNVLPATESDPSFDSTDIFFYYDAVRSSDFSRGERMDNEPGVLSQGSTSLFDFTDEFLVTPSLNDSCPAEIRCVAIYDVTNPRPAHTPTFSDTTFISARLIHTSSVSTSVEITPPAFGSGNPPIRGMQLPGANDIDTLKLFEADTYQFMCRAQGANPDQDILWTIDDCSGGMSTLLRQVPYVEVNTDCVPQDDTDVWTNYAPIEANHNDMCLRCTSGGMSDAYRLVIVPKNVCPADRVLIWEYVTPPFITTTIPFYYGEDTSTTVTVNVNEQRKLYCTSYESAPVTYIAWTTPTGEAIDKFISSDCSYTYEESQITSDVEKFDTTKCVDLTFGYDEHLDKIQCTATNIADSEGVNSAPISIYICVPCDTHLAIVARNFKDDLFDTRNESFIGINANGEARNLSCVNRGARGIPELDKPQLDVYIKEADADDYVLLTSADGDQLYSYENIVYDPNDPEYGKDKYKGLWEVRKDVTLSTQSRFDVDGAVLACVCRNKLYQRESEAWRTVRMIIIDTPLIDETFSMVQGYPFDIVDVADTNINLVNYGPFSTPTGVRRKRQNMEELEITCIARGTRPAVDILWRLDGELISDDLIVTNTQNSILNVGTGQSLVDTISTLTMYAALRTNHYKNVTCEVPSRNGDLIQRSVRLIVLTPPDTPLGLIGNDEVVEGERVTLGCHAINGYPEGVFQWIVGAGLLDDEEQRQTESTLLANYRYNQTSTLSFIASREHNGKEISCVLLQQYEDYGFVAETKAEIEITVNYCPSTSAKVTGCPSSPILPGQPITLTCESAMSNPVSSLEWRINGNTQTPTQSSTSRQGEYGYVTTQSFTLDVSETDDRAQVMCCHRAAIDGTPCNDGCDVCAIDVITEQPPPVPSTGCRWVRVRVTLENIQHNSAQWRDAYEDPLSTDYQQLMTRLLDVFRMIYDDLTDYKSSVVPSINRSPEGLIEVIIGIEFDSPYGSDTNAIHQALIDAVNANGVIETGPGEETDVDILPNSVGEDCVCPSDFCYRGPSCLPSEDDFSSSCQCPSDYAPPRCAHVIVEPQDVTTDRPSRGVIYARLLFILREIDDVPVSWSSIYDDYSSNVVRDINNGLKTVLTGVFSRGFSCLKTVTIADLFEASKPGVGVIAGLEFTHDCGNSLNAIRNVFIQSIDSDAKIDGSIYELDQDFIFEIGLEEVCGPYFSCANGGVCEPSSQYSSYCRCPSPYTGPRCEDILDDRTTPSQPTVKVDPDGGLTNELIIILTSVIFGAILIGLLLCVCCLFCCPGQKSKTRYVYTEHNGKDQRSRGFEDSYDQRRPVSDDWPWSGRGQPPVKYNSDSFKRNISPSY